MVYTVCMNCLSYDICSVSFDDCARQHIKIDTPCTFFLVGEGGVGAVGISVLLCTVDFQRLT